MPTAIVVGPSADGTTSVWPGLPSNPAAVSAARLRPSALGTVPDDPTGTATAATSFGTLRATLTVTGEEWLMAAQSGPPTRECHTLVQVRGAGR